jgi:Putative bacterial sensory transduction regulator
VWQLVSANLDPHDPSSTATGALHVIEDWLEAERVANPLIADVERADDPELGVVVRWYVRMRGEEKLVVTVWLSVKERALHYETYLCPAPEENMAQTYEYLLRVNQRLVGASFAIGHEDAVYLVGQQPLRGLTGADLDRILGTLYAVSEETFPTAMRIGYASTFRR